MEEEGGAQAVYFELDSHRCWLLIYSKSIIEARHGATVARLGTKKLGTGTETKT